MTQTPPRALPAMPTIGHPESFYARRIHEADKHNNHHAHEAWKVGQYVTLAMDVNLTWEQKLRYFQHALKRHCVPPPYPDDDVWSFYCELAQLVRTHAGTEALRLASQEDDRYAVRVDMGEDRDAVSDEAELFFGKMIPDPCPAWFHKDDYAQLKMIRDQWI